MNNKEAKNIKVGDKVIDLKCKQHREYRVEKVIREYGDNVYVQAKHLDGTKIVFHHSLIEIIPSWPEPR